MNSGKWAQMGGGGIATGVRGVLAPLKGKTITCTGCSSQAGCQIMVTVWAIVDINGDPFTKVRAVPPNAGYTVDSGNVPGRHAVASSGVVSAETADWDLFNLTSSAACSANWPLN